MMETYRDITYTLARTKRRKTASIYIERDGSVMVRVPQHLTTTEIENILERKRMWIYAGVAEWQAANASRVERQFVDGETFLYLGQRLRLQWVEQQPSPLQIVGDFFCLHKDVAAPLEAFKQFYRAQGRDHLPQRVAYFAPQLGVTVHQVRVMELKYRWASCSAKGNLNFHWKVMMAPPSIIDYLVVHELAHRIHPNHSDAFWNELDKIIPDYLQREAWIQEHGAGLDI